MQPEPRYLFVFAVLLMTVFGQRLCAQDDLMLADTAFIREHKVRSITLYSGNYLNRSDSVPGTPAWSFAFDKKGRLTERRYLESAGTHLMKCAYDEEGRLSQRETHSPYGPPTLEIFVHEKAGQHVELQKAETDIQQVVYQKTTFDPAGRILKEERYNPWLQLFDSVAWEYEPEDLIRITGWQPGRIRKGSTTLRRMDGKGNLLWEELFLDGKLIRRISLSYDEAGQLVKRTEKDEHGTLLHQKTWKWKNGSVLSSLYEYPGRVDPHTSEWEYFPNGLPRCTWESREMILVPATVKWEYNSRGEPARQTTYHGESFYSRNDYAYFPGYCQITGLHSNATPSDTLSQTVIEYVPGTRLPARRTFTYTYQSSPWGISWDQPESPPSCIFLRPDITLYQYEAGKVRSEYKVISCIEELLYFQYPVQTTYTPYPLMMNLSLTVLDTLSLERRGTETEWQGHIKVRRNAFNDSDAVILKRKWIIRNDTVLECSDTDADNQIWMEYSLKGEVAEGRYLSIVYERHGDTLWELSPYTGDTLTRQIFNSRGMLVRSDSLIEMNNPSPNNMGGMYPDEAETWVNQMIRYQCTTLFQYDRLDHLTEIRVFFNGNLAQVRQFRWDADRMVEEYSPDLRNNAFGKYVYEFYED